MTTSYRQWHALPKCQAGDFYKHPRTLVEAFPCDANHHVYSQFEPMTKQDKLVTIILTVILVCIGTALLTGEIK
jgi:hypothetical protein